MSESMDTKLRELTYRLIAMAPEAPPFPEEDMVQLKPSPAPAPPTRNRNPLVWVGVAAVVALLVVGVPLFVFGPGGSTGTTVPPVTQTTAPATTVPETTVPISGATVTYDVYLLSNELTTESGDALLVPVQRTETLDTALQPADLAALAVDRLNDISFLPDGYSTAVPGEAAWTAFQVVDGVATIDYPATFASGGGSASMFARLRQVVFTATQFPEIDSVLFEIDGEPVDVFSSEGIVLDGPQTRADWYDNSQPIYLDTPASGAEVDSPITISGTANVFEATLGYEVTIADGTVLADGFTTASCGTGCWGDFSVDVPYGLTEDTSGFVTVFTNSPEDGSRTNVTIYPVTLHAAEAPPAAAPEIVGLEGVVDGQTVVEPGINVGVIASNVDTVSIDGTELGVFEAGTVDGVQTYETQTDVTLAEGPNEIPIVLTGPGGTTTQTIHVTYAPDAEQQIAYLTQVGADEIVADYVQWLTGDAANQAAFEDGEIGSVEEGVPNGYYIRNTNSQLRNLPLADNALVILQTSATGPVSVVAVPADEWRGLFKDDGTPWDYETDTDIPDWPAPDYGYFGAGMANTPYWLTFDTDGNIIQIEQQYIP